MLDFFIEDEVKKLKDAGHREAKPIVKTDTLSRFVTEHKRRRLQGQEVILATTENLFWGLHPETEQQKMEALECVFSELGLGDVRMELDEDIVIDAEDEVCMCEGGDQGDRAVRAKFEELAMGK
jgi:hypothetical protein